MHEQDLCNALDELSEQQKSEEVLPINVQQVFVLCRLGRHQEAERLASKTTLSE